MLFLSIIEMGLYWVFSTSKAFVNNTFWVFWESCGLKRQERGSSEMEGRTSAICALQERG